MDPERQFPLTADRCGALAENLAEAIAKLRSWGIRVIDVNRLEQQRTMLERVAAEGVYPANSQELRRIGHALRDALEFRYIAACMPDEKLHQLVNELQHAVGGTIDRRESRRRPYQYQTQFWVGAVLAFGNVTPVIPATSSQKSPDYLVRNGTIHYGVEVKRPQRAESVERSLQEGCRQLAASRVGGAVVVDVSDCIATDAAEIIQHGDVCPSPTAAIESFTTLATRLERAAFDDDRNRVRAEFVPASVLVVVASIFRWKMSDLRCPELIKLCRFGRFYRVARPTLEFHRTNWLSEVLFHGMQATGHALVKNESGIDPNYFTR